MKYLFAIIVVGVIAATLSACGGSDGIARSEGACDKALRDRDYASRRIERFQQDFDRADPASAQSIYAASGMIQHGGLVLGLDDYLLECSNVSSDHKSQLASTRHEYVQTLQQLQSACRRIMGTVDVGSVFDDRLLHNARRGNSPLASLLRDERNVDMGRLGVVWGRGRVHRRGLLCWTRHCAWPGP